jgi:hypothetical protein
MASPTIYGWLYPPDSVRLLVHYDPFTVYDPGKPVGIKIRVGAPPIEERDALLPTTLPDPPIKILSSDGKAITSPVFDVEVSVWNGGYEPINRDKIRRPLVITFPHVDSLLGIRVLHENPNDGLKLIPGTSSPASVQVSWDYMDPGAGFKFAVIFATPDVLYPLQTNSYIAGAKVIDTDREIPGMSWRNVVITGGLWTLSSLFLLTLLLRVRKHRYVVQAILFLFVFSTSLWLAIFTIKGPAPPF